MIPQEILDLVDRVERPVVISHKGCRDGLASAFLCTRRWPGAKVILQAPQEEPLYLECLDKDVLILDLHLTRRQLDAVKLAARSVIALDHHPESAAAFEGLPWAYHDRARSGAGLTLDALFPGARQRGLLWLDDVARVILHVEAWDLWQHDRFPGVKEVCAGLDALQDWSPLPGLDELRARGRAILAYQSQQVERIAENATLTEWPDAPLKHEDGSIEVVKGGWLLAVNSPFCPGEIGELLYSDPLRAPAPLRAVLVYYRTKRGSWKCSLRSHADGADVGKLAKRFNGGGHEHAAGFTAATLEEALAGLPRIATWTLSGHVHRDEAGLRSCRECSGAPMPRRSG